MTLNTARKIETVFVWVLYALLVPVGVLALLLLLVKMPLDWILEGRDRLAFKVGHKLMHMSGAVKDGTIKNDYCLRCYTARKAWEHLKEAEESGKEANI